MASPQNRHCANCIGTLSFPSHSNRVNALILLTNCKKTCIVIHFAVCFDFNYLPNWSKMIHFRSRDNFPDIKLLYIGVGVDRKLLHKFTDSFNSLNVL